MARAEKKDDVLQSKESIIRLFDVYGGLLTENQREITNLYFNLDLSLAEIAEGKGVSRQSVSDCLQKSRKILEDAEKGLGHARELEGYAQKIARVRAWADEQKRLHPEWLAALQTLEGLLGENNEG